MQTKSEDVTGKVLTIQLSPTYHVEPVLVSRMQPVSRVKLLSVSRNTGLKFDHFTRDLRNLAMRHAACHLVIRLMYRHVCGQYQAESDVVTIKSSEVLEISMNVLEYRD